MNEPQESEKPDEPQQQHYGLRLEPVVFNHTPILGETPPQGEVNGRRE